MHSAKKKKKNRISKEPSVVQDVVLRFEYKILFAFNICATIFIAFEIEAIVTQYQHILWERQQYTVKSAYTLKYLGYVFVVFLYFQWDKFRSIQMVSKPTGHTHVIIGLFAVTRQFCMPSLIELTPSLLICKQWQLSVAP